MTKGPKQRLLQDLYNVTRTVSQPKITPVLRGICQMQGPADEADCDFSTNMRVEAGACNLCSDQQLMGSKINECSGETCTGYASNVSVNGAVPNDKILKAEIEHKSEIRNLDSGNSNITTENVYSEVSMRNSGLSTAFQDVAPPKVDEPNGKECPDDSMSCATGSEDVKLSDLSVSNGVTAELPTYAASDGTLISPGNGKMFSHRTSFPCEDMKWSKSPNNHSGQSKNSEESSEQMPVSVCLPTDLSLQNSELVGATQENAVDMTRSPVKAGSSHAPCGCGKSLYNEENLCSHFHEGMEVTSEHLNSLSMKEVTSDVVHNEMAIDAFQVTDKVVGSSLSPGAKGNFPELQTMDESEGSDMMEHDVKVCDICGDTGREDLLAICCRCSDGAEHTYCMREMLVKVPEGDWLCEECKFVVAIENQKQDKISSADGNEKSSSSQANPEKPNCSKKSEAKGSNSEGTKPCKDPSGVKISAKRHMEDVEVSSAAKKRNLGSNVGPAKSLLSNSGVALSHDNSFKQLDRGKIKPTQQSSSSTIAAPELADSPASGSRLQIPQGAFLKSNSFNSLNAKPKVKLVDGIIPQKQRSAREPISLNKKEEAARSLGKSMSFKYTNSSLLNGSESKVKMPSSKFPHIQDMKESKYTKDRNLFERKNSFNSERAAASSPMPTSSSFAAKNDKKLSSCAEASLVSSVRNQRDTKPVQSNNKSVTLSRSSSFAVHKGSEMPVSLGEVKRQSSQLATGVYSTNGISSCDMKPKPSSPMEDSSSSSSIAERPPCNANEGLADGLSRLKESTSFCERRKESSIGRSKQGNASGRTVICQKCNDIGHLAQFCPGVRPASPVSDVSAGKSSRELMEGKDNLKAAIEAAVLRKPGIYRKNRVLDLSDDVSGSSISGEIAPQDYILKSSNRGNASAAEEMSGGGMIPENSSTDSCKQATIDNVRQSGMLHVEALTSRTGDVSHGITTEGSSLIREMLGQVPATMSILLKTLPIPDHEYIWQGNFEVYRNGKILKFYDRIQAHISNCASPRVLQAVNKFPRKVVLNEVPRLSIWPRQFQEHGVKEDNVALFFYSEDLLSYEKSYKVLLDNMMKNDLALEGKLDDIELLVFSSNQLPEKSQRWNKMFFLWGVFRGRRAGCSERVLRSEEQIHFAQETVPAIKSLPENICSVRPVYKDLSECGESALALEILASRDFPCSSSSQTLVGDCDARVFPQGLSDHHMQAVEKQDHRVDSSSFLVVRNSNPESHEEIDTNISREEMQCTSTSVEGGVEHACKLEQEAATRTAGFDKCEQMPKDENSSFSERHSRHQFDKSTADGHRALGGGFVLDKMSTTRCQVDLEDGSVLNSPPCGTIDETVKENKKRQHVETVERILESASASTGKAIPGNSADRSVEEVHPSKRQKNDFCGMYGGSDQTSSPIEGSMSGIHNIPSGSPFRTECRAEGFDGTDVHRCEGNAERYFFPVGPHAEEIDINKAAQSFPWKLNPSEDDRLLGKAPNLELALGAETKPLLQGIPTFLVGKEENKIIQDHCSHEGTTRGEEDDESASLSLSLSFPFPDEEQRLRSISGTERQHVNTWLLFGDSRHK